MNTITMYSRKAEKYDKFRWDYSPNAIQTIFEFAQLSRESSLADIGGGTGILSKHFLRKVKNVFIVEPNSEMRQIAETNLRAATVVAATAENTTLPDHSIDLVTVAQSIHWFNPESARREFQRILKPQGWLAILQNYGTNKKLNKSLKDLSTKENGVDFSSSASPPEQKDMNFYFGHDHFHQMTFPFSFQQGWEEFIGSLTSASYMPDDDNPLYSNLENAARKVFDKFSVDGWLTVCGETELYLGQP